VVPHVDVRENCKDESENATRPCRLASVVHQHFSVLLTHGNKKLVNRHGRIDGDFATKEVPDVVLLCTRETRHVKEG
jgi:hypothetical protein